MTGEPWRYRCPTGDPAHTSWYSTPEDSRGDYFCTQCKEHFDKLRDMKEERLTRRIGV